MNKNDKEIFFGVIFSGLIAQLLVYGAYGFFSKLNIFIVLVAFIVYVLVVILLHLFGAYLKKILKNGK